MQSSNHILSQEGILITFAVARKIGSDEIKKMRSKIKTTNTEEQNEKLQKIILEETQKAIDEDQIPGLVVKSRQEEEQKKRMMELTFFASIIAKKMKEKKIDKYYSCYIINAIVNMLGLTEKDFDDFHDKFSKNGDEDESVG